MKILKIVLTLTIAISYLAMAPYNTSDVEHNHHDIVSLAEETEELSTLYAAIQAADLVDVLQSDGPFTVFAPTNAAFDALPDGTLEYLLQPENRDELVNILTYHVVAGEVMSGDLSDGMTAETVEGSEVTISVNNYGVSVNDAGVVTADIEASNGVIHVIDALILPPEEESGY